MDPFAQIPSTRSSSNGIHPTCPSLSAIRSWGERGRIPDSSQSARAAVALSEVSDIVTLNGASGEVEVKVDEEPMCILTTVFVSAHAAKKGSQWPEWMLEIG